MEIFGENSSTGTRTLPVRWVGSVADPDAEPEAAVLAQNAFEKPDLHGLHQLVLAIFGSTALHEDAATLRPCLSSLLRGALGITDVGIDLNSVLTHWLSTASRSQPGLTY